MNVTAWNVVTVPNAGNASKAETVPGNMVQTPYEVPVTFMIVRPCRGWMYDPA